METELVTLYTAVWTDVPRAQYDALPDVARKAFDKKFEAVLNDPYGVGDYDKLADQWSTDFAGGAGMLVYVVGDKTIRVVVLRVYFA